MEQTDRRLLPAHHTLSVFPERSFVSLTAIAVCSLVMMAISFAVAIIAQEQIALATMQE